MQVALLTVTLRAPWAHSLKDKRAEVQRLHARLRAKFNLSVAETGAQDAHQTIVLSAAALAANPAQANSILDHVLGFIEASTDAEVVDVQRELR